MASWISPKITHIGSSQTQGEWHADVKFRRCNYEMSCKLANVTKEKATEVFNKNLEMVALMHKNSDDTLVIHKDNEIKVIIRRGCEDEPLLSQDTKDLIFCSALYTGLVVVAFGLIPRLNGHPIYR